MPSLPSPEDMTDLMHALSPFSATIGARVIEIATDEVTLEAEWAEERCTNAGALHGGYLMSLADCAGAVLAMLNLPEGAGTSTTDSNTHFLRAARSGPVRATARLVKAGRSLIVVRTEVAGPEGKPFTVTTQSQIVLLP